MNRIDALLQRQRRTLLADVLIVLLFAIVITAYVLGARSAVESRAPAPAPAPSLVASAPASAHALLGQ